MFGVKAHLRKKMQEDRKGDVARGQLLLPPGCQGFRWLRLASACHESPISLSQKRFRLARFLGILWVVATPRVPAIALTMARKAE